MISLPHSCSLLLPIQLLMTPYKGLSQSNRPWPSQYLFHYFGPFFHHGQVFYTKKVVDYSQGISKYLRAVFILSLVLSIAITSPYQGVICCRPKFRLKPMSLHRHALIVTISLRQFLYWDVSILSWIHIKIYQNNCHLNIICQSFGFSRT